MLIAKLRCSHSPSPTSRPSASNKWKEFTSPTGKFAVSMPTTPQEQVENGTHVFQSSVPGESYLLLYADSKEALSTSPAGLNALTEGFATGANFKIVRSQNIKLGNHSGQEFEFVSKSDNSKGKGRVYAVGKRAYILVAKNTGQNSQRFLNSFRLISK